MLDILRSGKEKLREPAEATAKEVRERLGLELSANICEKVKIQM